MKSSFAAATLTVMRVGAGALTALLACDAGLEAPGQGGVEPVSLAQFSVRYAQTSCLQNFKCCAQADLVGRSPKQCTDDNASALDLLASMIGDGQSAGRITYDAAKMGMCLSAVGKMTCDDWKMSFTLSKNQPDACLAAVVPLVPAGYACQQDIECKTGYCDSPDPSTDPSTDLPIDGTCTPAIASGAACTVDGPPCADGLVCNGAAQKCTARKAAGKPCVSDGECLNACNLTTGLCSSYVGCGIAGGDPRPAQASWVVVGAALLFGTRRRRRRA